MHPLADADPADRKAARATASAPDVAAWLRDPKPDPPPLELQQQIARAIADAIGWKLDLVNEAITELHSYPNQTTAAPIPDADDEEDTDA